MSTSAPSSSRTSSGEPATGPAVIFENSLNTRKYILNKPKQLNALDEEMIDLLRPKVDEWNKSELCKLVIGTGNGRAFCAGGDVRSVIKHSAQKETVPTAVRFFQKEFELDYALASLTKPYIAVMEGITMGGGVGLSVHAPFRIATESTVFAMPETKIGYFPDVGATYFLPRLDGHLGEYLGLTGTEIRGRAVFQHGLATHFVPSRRLPALLENLSSLSEPTEDVIAKLLDEYYDEATSLSPSTRLVGPIREAIDLCFAHPEVEDVIKHLEGFATHSNKEVANWAKDTLQQLHLRSPTSLKISLEAIRRGRSMKLDEALKQEIVLATAICNGATEDMQIGVRTLLLDKSKERPNWNPSTLSEVKREEILPKFFPSKPSELIGDFSLPQIKRQGNSQRHTLPSETAIKHFVQGSHPASGNYGVSVDELVERFETMTGKNGVGEKVREVANRKCTMHNGVLQWQDKVN
jgi:3-hydroxyisobutyryl-CoA hydrolase